MEGWTAESLPVLRTTTIPNVLGEVLTAIVTPFREDGSIDLEAFRALCGFLLDNGSDGIVVAGCNAVTQYRRSLVEMALGGEQAGESVNSGCVVHVGKVA